MKDTILSKDTVSVTIGEDHSYNCTVVTLGRTGENAVSQLEITIPEELSGFWAYLDFKKPRGQTVKTPKLDIVNNKIEYDIPAGLLNENGNLEVQLVLQSETGEIWKSSVKKYVVLKSIDASEDIPEKEDFITEAQKVLDSIDETVSNTASAIVETVSGTAVALADVSPIKHTLDVKARRKNLIDFSRPATETKVAYGYLNEDGKTITSKFTDDYYSNVTLYYLNDWLLKNKGKTITFSVKESYSDVSLAMVIWGDRTNGATYQSDNSPNGATSFSLKISEDFISINRIELRFNRAGVAFTTERVFSEFQLELNPTKTPYAPYVADLSAVDLVAGGKNFAQINSIKTPTSEKPIIFSGKITGNFVLSCDLNCECTNLGATLFAVTLEDGIKEITPYTIMGNPNGYPLNGTITKIQFINYSACQDGSVDNIQLELGASKTVFEPHNGLITYPINADGTAEGVKSIYPNMSLVTDTDGVVIDTTYNVDTKKFILNEIAKTMALVLEG